MDVLAISMKLLTFLGVVAAAIGLSMTHAKMGRFALLGFAGVGLMVANAWLAPYPGAVLVDAAYLVTCCALVARVFVAPVAFEILEEQPA